MGYYFVMSFLETVREHWDTALGMGVAEVVAVWEQLYTDATAAAKKKRLSPVVEANLVRAAISRCRNLAGEHILTGRISDAQAASNTATQLSALLPDTLNREHTRTIVQDIIKNTGAADVASIMGCVEDRADIDQALLALIAREELEESQAEQEAEAA